MDEVEDTFYNQLSGVFDKLPQWNVNNVVWDTTTKTGVDNIDYKEMMGQHVRGGMNENCYLSRPFQ